MRKAMETYHTIQGKYGQAPEPHEEARMLVNRSAATLMEKHLMNVLTPPMLVKGDRRKAVMKAQADFATMDVSFVHCDTCIVKRATAAIKLK